MLGVTFCLEEKHESQYRYSYCVEVTMIDWGSKYSFKITAQ
jgi:hypothetical protein